VQDVRFARDRTNHIRSARDTLFFHLAGRPAHHRSHAGQDYCDQLIGVAIALRQERLQALCKRRGLRALRSRERYWDGQGVFLLFKVLVQRGLTIQRDDLPARLNLLKGDNSPGVRARPGFPEKAVSVQNFHIAGGSAPAALESFQSFGIQNQPGERRCFCALPEAQKGFCGNGVGYSRERRS